MGGVELFDSTTEAQRALRLAKLLKKRFGSVL
jgi:hypothetical protein